MLPKPPTHYNSIILLSWLVFVLTERNVNFPVNNIKLNDVMVSFKTTFNLIYFERFNSYRAVDTRCLGCESNQSVLYREIIAGLF